MTVQHLKKIKEVQFSKKKSILRPCFLFNYILLHFKTEECNRI